MYNIREGRWNNVEVRLDGHVYRMTVDGQQVMCFNLHDQRELHELQYHIKLARDKTVVTGLGFGIREHHILQSSLVKQLVIVEKNQAVIDYHHTINSPLLTDPRVTIVHADALTYVDQCDVLLIDHYLDGPLTRQIESWLNIANTVQNNINSRVTWVWPIELMAIFYNRDLSPFTNYLHFRDTLRLPDLTEQEFTQAITDSSYGKFLT